MKRKRIFVPIIILLIVGCVCIIGIEDENCHKVKKITVYTAAENPENICIVSCPYNYMAGGEWKSMEETALKAEKFSKEDARFIWKYIVDLETPEYMEDYELYMDDYKALYEGHTFICAVRLEYEDSLGNGYSIDRFCFDTYPDGFREFVSEFNGVCGAEYLTDNTKVQKITPEYLKEVTEITEDVFSPMGLEEVIETLDLDMFDLAVDNRGLLDAYELIEMMTTKYLPREIQNEESTVQEFGHFVSAFVRDNFGKSAFDDLDVQYFDNVSYCRMRIDGRIVYFFRSCCINDDSTDPWIHKTTYRDQFDYYMWMETDGEMTWGQNFYYNADGKYGMVFNANYSPATVEAFVNAK